MIRFTVEVTGADKASTILGAILAPMREMRLLWPEVRPALESAAMQRFLTEGASDGRAWEPLSPAYAKRKASTHPGRGILVREGDLKNSLLSRGGPGNVYREGPNSMTWGTSDPKAEHHQLGTGRMPAREILRVTPADERAIERTVERAIMDRAKAAGA